MEQVGRIILGKDEQIKEIMLSFLANGHILLEDIPGVGKTTLALAFSKAMSLEYKRVQFTPDVMPSDLTGFSIYRRESEQFVYQPGSVFCNLFWQMRSIVLRRKRSLHYWKLWKNASDSRRDHEGSAISIYGNRNAKSIWKCWYAASSGSTGGSFHDIYVLGIS